MNFFDREPWGQAGQNRLVDLEIDGDFVPVEIRSRRGLKRLTLRINPKTGNPSISAPVNASDATIQSFVSRKIDWIRDQQATLQPPLQLFTGAKIPFQGSDVEIFLTNRSPRTVFWTDQKLIIGGPADMSAARLETYLKQESKKRLKERVAYFEDELGEYAHSISIRDTVSRWGSCSSKGRLNFSWRLIMAPEAVLDYVAAHEVSHLREMNHSKRFWALVARLDPHWKESRDWLRNHGRKLLSLRFKSPSN